MDEAILTLVSMFHNELAEVRFPGVDAKTLDAAMAAVTEQAAEAQRRWRAHQDALETLREHEQALREHVKQAHAYARIFAHDDPELIDRLDAIKLAPEATSAPVKRRGKRRKESSTPQLTLDKPVADKQADKPTTGGGRRATGVAA